MVNVKREIPVDRQEMEKRVLAFAVRSLRFLESLPTNQITRVIVQQTAKSSTSIGANYCEAWRAQSRADFITKIAIAAKEASETGYWYKIMDELKWGSQDECMALAEEARELLAIMVATGKTAKTRESGKTSNSHTPFAIHHSPSL